MHDCNSKSTLVEWGVKLSKYNEDESRYPIFFKTLVRSLYYFTCTRPNSLYAIGLVSRYMEDPKTTYFKAVKRIFHYTKGTIDCGLLYSFLMTISSLDIVVASGVRHR